MRVDAQRMAEEFTAERKDNVKPLTVARDSKKTAQDKENQDKITMESLKGTQKANRENTELAVKVMNEAMKISNYHLEFQMYENSGEYQVKVIDSDSKEVIREIPADYVLEQAAQISKKMDEMIGVLVDEIA